MQMFPKEIIKAFNMDISSIVSTFNSLPSFIIPTLSHVLDISLNYIFLYNVNFSF